LYWAKITLAGTFSCLLESLDLALMPQPTTIELKAIKHPKHLKITLMSRKRCRLIVTAVAIVVPKYETTL